jgi:exopolyphosphatase / guanosine-5'-triphosphate,3'-diphosphate pyrophosphatase
MTEHGAFAALDCGTNSTRLLVTDAHGRALVREMRITRLGQAVDQTRRLRADSIERTLDALREFRGLMDREEVRLARLVATSAVRDAANGHEFLAAAAAVTGVEAELLSGEEEGRLSYSGAMAGLPAIPWPTVVVDIGGGSTEIVTSSLGDIRSISLDIGCVRLTERFLLGDPPSSEEVTAATEAIAVQLYRAQCEIPLLEHLPEGARLVGLAGTVSTLASLELGLGPEYDRERIHHSVLTGEAVGRWCDLLGRERVATRAARPAIPLGRADIILGGALVLKEVMSRLRCDRCIVSESDILDGLVLSLLAR